MQCWIEIFTILGGIATVFGLFLGPMFYLGQKISNLQNDVHTEMKDFHGRLCTLEERFLNWLEKNK